MNQPNGACIGLFGGKPGYISDLYDETVFQEVKGISMLYVAGNDFHFTLSLVDTEYRGKTGK